MTKFKHPSKFTSSYYEAKDPGGLKKSGAMNSV